MAAPAPFRFGENWQSFVATVGEDQIRVAEDGLLRLLPRDRVAGARFLDIGCGSGLSSLAALRLGARSVEGIDADAQSVEAATALLEKFAAGGPWRVAAASVFELAPERHGTFDVVYSWGVLHHTGDLWRALAHAAAMTAPDGTLVVALYRKTPLCGFWRWEKRLYAGAGPRAQRAMRALYKTVFAAGLLASGRSPARYIAAYRSDRGMDWHHDVHDWLGGYPYESTGPAEVEAFLEGAGFTLERALAHPARALGVFGSHCDEYVARRRT
ncbi:MAG TPA: class I SAM-dependent methyltransferase [Stellaceae bacterium]|nr:class I SAM-dependent methyltransferase [Stellaceae bacterium]